jgi:predicted small lipoprotein YifL
MLNIGRNSMKFVSTMAIAVGMSLALAACGGKGDDKLGEQAQEAAENKADKLDAMADNASGTSEDLLDARADTTREAGEAREEAIDESDVNAEALSPTERAKVINGN